VSRITDIFPGVETAVQLEPEELAVPLLEYPCQMEERRGGNTPHLGDFLSSESLRDYAGSRYDELIKVATEAWMWLLHEGLIAPHPTRGGNWVFVTRRGNKFRRLGDPEKFRAANMLPHDTLDPTLASKVRPPFLRGDYDSVVFEAFKEVEIRVRNLSDDNSDFSSPVWDYADTDSDKTSQAVPSARLSYSTTYYWRVRYQDSHGLWSEWSDGRSFTVDRYSPVYRFWKASDNTHFFTIKESEKQKLIDNYSHIYTFEGVAYYAYVKDQPPAGTLPLYRFWKPSDDTHFYTIKESEKQKLIDNYSHMFTYEGPAYYAYGIAQHPLGTLPVYRFWKPSGNTHFFTIRESEKDKLIALFSHIVTFEGIAWYAYAV